MVFARFLFAWRISWLPIRPANGFCSFFIRLANLLASNSPGEWFLLVFHSPGESSSGIDDYALYRRQRPLFKIIKEPHRGGNPPMDET
jgi:hypothetical protein